MRPSHAILFDLDGVLVTTDELHYRAWKSIADEQGIPFDREVNHRLRGVSRMESLEIMLERATRPYTDDEKLALATTKNERYRAGLGALGTEGVLPGAVETLDALDSAGVRYAVASSSKNARAILEAVGLFDRFEVVVDGNDIARSKPDPEVFLKAAERLNAAPSDCLVIEDAEAGVQAARAAGMRVVAVGSASAFGAADAVIASLAEFSIDRHLRAD